MTRYGETLSTKKIGSLGVHALHTLFLNWNWVARDFTGEHDQGIDLAVEISDQGTLLNRHFFVQAKASKAQAGFTKKFINVHINDSSKLYIERQTLPVFVFVVDLKLNQIFYLLVNPEEKNTWVRVQKSWKVRVNRSSLIDSSAESRDRFVDELNRAYARIGTRGVSLAAHVHEISSKLKERDPRFDVSVEVISGAERITIDPREPVDLTLNFQSEDPSAAVKALEDLQLHGRPAALNVSALTITGSDIFSDILGYPKSGQLVLQPNVRHADVDLGVPSNGPGGFRRLATVKCEISGGTQSMTLRGPPHSIFVLSSTFTPAESKGKVQFSLSRWNGHALMNLGELDDADRLLSAIIDRGQMRVRIRAKGVSLNSTVSFTAIEIARHKEILEWIHAFQALREICARFGADVTMGGPDTASADEAMWWIGALSLLDGESVFLTPTTLGMELPGASEEVISKLIASEAPLFVRNVPLAVDAFGQRVCSINCSASLRNFGISKQAAKDSYSLIPKENARIRLRLASDCEPTIQDSLTD